MWLASKGGLARDLVVGVEDARIVITGVVLGLVVLDVVRRKLGSLADRF
ncbi:hypothetical protein [Halolamina sp.]